MLSQENNTGKKRPIIITIFCVLGFFVTLCSIPIIFFVDTKDIIGAWFPPVFLFFSALELITLVGLWMMKKWSVILYIVIFATVQVALLATGSWSISTLINPGILLAISFTQYTKMD